MMRLGNTNYVSLLAIGIIFLLAGCSESETSTKMVVTLIDSPGDYKAVNVDIQGISVHTNETADEEDGGWVMLEGGEVGVKNLLDYTGGTELTLADTEFPTGKISQMRLHLGTENTVDIEQEDESVVTEDLNVTSGDKSGLKLLINETLEAGITYKFTLDFDAAKSVVPRGNGKYNLKPVIKVITEATSGAVEGIVTPAEETVAVHVIDGLDTLGSSYAPEGSENYLVPGIKAGNFIVAFDPGENSDYNGAVVEEVSFTDGVVTQLDPVALELK